MLLIYLEWGRKVLDIADRNLRSLSLFQVPLQVASLRSTVLGPGWAGQRRSCALHRAPQRVCIGTL